MAVSAPVGRTVNNIASGAETANTGTINNYYYAGTYYKKNGSSDKAVAPTARTLVDKLPEGGEEITIGDVKFVKFGETYYQPVQVGKKDKYEEYKQNHSNHIKYIEYDKIIFYNFILD